MRKHTRCRCRIIVFNINPRAQNKIVDMVRGFERYAILEEVIRISLQALIDFEIEPENDNYYENAMDSLQALLSLGSEVEERLLTSKTNVVLEFSQCISNNFLAACHANLNFDDERDYEVLDVKLNGSQSLTASIIDYSDPVW